MGNEDDDNLPTLHDVLRPGDGAPTRRAEEVSNADRERNDTSLTETEIEAIVHRVIEQHTEYLQKALTEAIHEAIDTKNRERRSGGDDPDDDRG